MESDIYHRLFNRWAAADIARASFNARAVYLSSVEQVRVIGGTYRGRRLRTAEGLEVRPTSDRLRETLFNILAPKVTDSRFLDICAGSGAVGIEALSRGATHSTFIESSRRASAVIEANLEALGIADASIVNQDALSALKQFQETDTQFDIIFFDPPYASELYGKAMELLGVGDLLAAGGIVVVEHRVKAPTEARYGDLQIYREVKQGESALAFYARV